eukprot:gene12883-biopygen15538
MGSPAGDPATGQRALAAESKWHAHSGETDPGARWRRMHQPARVAPARAADRSPGAGRAHQTARSARAGPAAHYNAGGGCSRSGLAPRAAPRPHRARRRGPRPRPARRAGGARGGGARAVQRPAGRGGAQPVATFSQRPADHRPPARTGQARPGPARPGPGPVRPAAGSGRRSCGRRLRVDGDAGALLRWRVGA